MTSFNMDSLLNELRNIDFKDSGDIPTRYDYKCEFMRVLCITALNYSEEPRSFSKKIIIRFNVQPKTFQDLIYVMADNNIPFTDITEKLISNDILVFMNFIISQTYRNYLIDKIINKLDNRKISFEFEGRRYTYPIDFTLRDILMYHNREFIDRACSMYINEFIDYVHSDLAHFFAVYCYINEIEKSILSESSSEDECGFYQNITMALDYWKEHQ